MKHVHSFLIPKYNEINATREECGEIVLHPIQELLYCMSTMEGCSVLWHMHGSVHIVLIHPHIGREYMISSVKENLSPEEAEFVLGTYEYGTIEPVTVGIPV